MPKADGRKTTQSQPFWRVDDTLVTWRAHISRRINIRYVEPYSFPELGHIPRPKRLRGFIALTGSRNP